MQRDISSSRLMRKFSRRGVSPVIATIMMVAITVILSATVVVMVMSFNSSGGSSRYGAIAMVDRNANDQYTFYFAAFTPQTRFSEVKASIAGQLTENALSTYTSSSRYSNSRSVSYMYHVDLGGEGFINAGDSMVVKFTIGMAGKSAEELIVFSSDGNVIAGTSVIVSGGGEPAGLDLTPFVAYGAPQPTKSWPLVLNKASSQYLKLVDSSAYQPTNSLTIETKFTVDILPTLQNRQITILDRYGDNDYRLQIIYDQAADRCWIEFGMSNGWVRSNGMRSAGGAAVATNFNVAVQTGVEYTVVAKYFTSVGKIQLFVQVGGGGSMQLAGERPYSVAFPINNQPLFIGANPGRYFDGTIYYITIKVT